MRQTDNDEDYENQYSDYDHKQSLTSEQIARLQHQHYLNDQILKQQELMKEQQEAERRQIEEYERQEYERQEKERQAYERQEKERQEQERQEQERRELARKQQEIINQEQMRQSVGSRAGRSGSSKAEPIISKKTQATGSAASLSSKKDGRESTTKSVKDRLKEFEKDYELAPLKLIGKLRGKHVIKDQAHINDESLNEFNKIYENYEKQSGKEGGEDEERSSNIYDISYFKDEMIDVDYGAIDAYTAAINAHLTAEKNNEPAPTNLQFASHILKSNHATFVENQIFLGDNFRNNASTTIDEEAESGRNKVNVKIFNPKLFQDQETHSNGSIGGDHTPTNTNQNNTNNNFDDYDQYSRSNSFGSVVDIQSQPAYSVADLNGDLNNLSNIINSANKNNFNSDVYSNNNTIRSTSNFVNLNSSTNNNLNSNNNNNSTSNLNNRSNSNMNNSIDSNIFNGLGKSKQSLSGIYNLDSLLTASLYQNRWDLA